MGTWEGLNRYTSIGSQSVRSPGTCSLCQPGRQKKKKKSLIASLFFLSVVQIPYEVINRKVWYWQAASFFLLFIKTELWWLTQMKQAALMKAKMILGMSPDWNSASGEWSVSHFKDGSTKRGPPARPKLTWYQTCPSADVPVCLCLSGASVSGAGETMIVCTTAWKWVICVRLPICVLPLFSLHSFLITKRWLILLLDAKTQLLAIWVRVSITCKSSKTVF